MSERAYTVSEIDALRKACQNRYLWGTAHGCVSSTGNSGTMARSYREEEMAACVEQTVRTHMMAGHTADDLLDHDGGTRR